MDKWIRLMRQVVAIDKPDKIYVSRAFFEALEGHGRATQVRLGRDAKSIEALGMTFRGVPIVKNGGVDEDVL